MRKDAEKTEGSDLLVRLNKNYKTLSKGQKQLAAYITENYDRAAFITASKMGRIVGVSESTVVRFAYALGYDGYPELQKSLQELIRNKLTSVQRIQLTGDLQPNDVLRSVLKSDVSNIRATIDSIDNASFNAAINALLEAKKVYIVGLMSAAPLAQFLAYYLGFVMDNVVMVSGAMGNIYEDLFRISSEDVCIGISFPRYSNRTIDALDFARGKDATIIAIADSVSSPIAEKAEHALIARSDMAGFAAATYLRGIDFVQIPTSLLAQVDSSVGGKTGVDIAQGKNLVGAFYQPKAVLIDPDTLSTLPDQFITDGMAEVIKYGCIKDSEFFEMLANGDALEHIDDVIETCVKIKRDVVNRDEKEAGERMLLNFGHTLGHAIEKIYNYTGITHGMAVAVGMVMMTKASEKHGLTEAGTAYKIEEVCATYGLPTTDDASLEKIAEAAQTDKKTSGSSINVVLLEKIGTSFTKKVAISDLLDFITP